jgi:hypothetical protein
VEILLGIIGLVGVMFCSAIAYFAYTDKTVDSFSRFVIILLMIIGVLGIGYEIANPCVEFEDECEIECWGDGTPAYECDCIYPCKKRKFD